MSIHVDEMSTQTDMLAKYTYSKTNLCSNEQMVFMLISLMISATLSALVCRFNYTLTSKPCFHNLISALLS